MSSKNKGLSDAATNRCISEEIDVSELRAQGIRLSDWPPDNRGFNLKQQIYQREVGSRRPLCFEGWVNASEGPRVPVDLKNQVVGVYRPDQVYMHLKSKALGGGAFADNGAPGTAKLNGLTVQVEKDAVTLSRHTDVYFRQVFEYDDTSSEVKAVDVQIWTRGQDGKPKLLTRRHATENGFRDYGQPVSSWTSWSSPSLQPDTQTVVEQGQRTADEQQSTNKQRPSTADMVTAGMSNDPKKNQETIDSNESNGDQGE